MTNPYLSLASLLGFAFLLMYTPLRAQTDALQPIHGLCIYIDYPDAPASITPGELDPMLNELDYETPVMNRSFRDYWRQETRRNVDFTHDIFYYTAPQPSSYYTNLQWFEGIELWRDALEAFIVAHPDYDWDSLSRWTPTDPYNDERPEFIDGAIKSVMVISSVWGPAGVGAAHYPVWTLSNGEVIGTIQGSVLQAPWHSTLNLFMLCHETGHSVFNIPDTYDYDASSGGTAKYSLMSAQGPDVEPVGAPFLAQHHWGTVVEPGIGTHTITLRADGDSVVILRNLRDPQEFFALEARKNSTLGNSLFPVPLGLLLWHSDRKVHTTNTLEDGTRFAHYRHAIIQKDGLYELESGPSPPINAGDIYVEGDAFSDTTYPDAHWWSGEPSGIEVTDIELLDDQHVRFTVTVSEPPDDYYGLLPKEDWVITAETPGLSGHEGIFAIDNDPETYYHVPWGSIEPRPHELVIDLGEEYEVNEFYYTANDNYSPPWEGRIRDYELAFSLDGVNWNSPILTEQFFRTPYRQYALFSPEVTRYVRFSAYTVFGDDSRTSIAEIDIRGQKANMTYTADPLSRDQVTISPNPTRNQVWVNHLPAGSRITLSTVTGQTLIQKAAFAAIQQIDLGDLPAGLYVLTVLGPNRTIIEKKKIIRL